LIGIKLGDLEWPWTE